MKALIDAFRVWWALRLIGWAAALLPLHYGTTFYVLEDLCEAIVEDFEDDHRRALP